MMPRMPHEKLNLPKVRGGGGLGMKPYGQSTAGSPDVLGPLRRARQVLAGEPTAVRTSRPMIPKPKLPRVAQGSTSGRIL